MRAIPRVAHRVWLQGRDQLPDHLAELCQTFDDLHPGWETQWWSHERICDELDMRAARQTYLDAELHVPPDAVMQLRADIARYAILRAFGGVTLDTDYRFFKPIDELLPGAAVVMAHEVDGGWIANGFMAANAKHTLHTRLLDGIPANAEALAGKGLRANTYTGPKYLTPLVRGMGARPDVRVLPSALFHGVPWNKPELADRYDRKGPRGAYAVHYWAHQRGIRTGGKWKTWGEMAGGMVPA